MRAAHASCARLLVRSLAALALLGGTLACEELTPVVSAVPDDPTFRPERLDFGVLPLGRTSTDTVVVSNPNGGTVFLTSLRVEGADRANFAVDGQEIEIEGNRTRQVSVRFAPMKLGRIQADLEIFHSEARVPAIITLVGTGTTAGPVACVDVDGDGYPARCEEATDCDDTDETIYPGAEEICDGVDNDCDDLRDEGLVDTRYVDADEDTWGTGTATVVSVCPEPRGYASRGGDCRDDLPAVNPGASEVCDGVDNDCNMQIDDGFPPGTFFFDGDRDQYGDAASSTVACSAPAGFVAQAGDCDDTRADISPAQVELCDGLDNDCNGFADDGLPLVTGFLDGDNDTFGTADSSTVGCSLPAGYIVRAGDCDDTRADINPLQAEICDGLDNNCNGVPDEGLAAQTYYLDFDMDMFGDPTTSTVSCTPPPGWVLDNQDCNDAVAAANPNGTEICTGGIDEDCDTLIDGNDPDCQCTTQNDCGPSSNGSVCPRTGALALQCRPLCRDPGDCLLGEACRPLPGSAGLGWCQANAGAVPENGACTLTSQCSTGICFGGACKRVCQSQADCTGGDVCGTALYSAADIGGGAFERQTMLCQPLLNRQAIGTGNCLLGGGNADTGQCATTHCDWEQWRYGYSTVAPCAPLCAGAGDCGPNQVCGIVFNSSLEVPPIQSTQEGAGRFHDGILGCYTPHTPLGIPVPRGFGGLGAACSAATARTACRSHQCAQFAPIVNRCTDFCDDDADCVSPATPNWRCQVAEINFASLFLQGVQAADPTKFSLVGICAP